MTGVFRLLIIGLLQAPQQQPSGVFTLGGTPGAGYTMSASGSGTDSAGAVLTLRSTTAPAGAFGSISGSVPADSFRLRRIRVVADIDARDVAGGASPWLRVDGPNGALSLDNGTDQALKGTASGRRETNAYVPANATRIVFGLLRSGSGEATGRGLRLVMRPRVSADAPLPPAARAVLDSAFKIVRRASLWRDTVTWPAVETDVRAVAAGAETADDVHPAIRLLLARLGDHHSFLMKPSGAQAFRTGGAQNPRPVVRVETQGVGYVAVAAYSGADTAAARQYAKGMQDSLAAIVSQGELPMGARPSRQRWRQHVANARRIAALPR